MDVISKIIVGLVIVYILLLAVLYLFQGQILFLPEREFYRTPSSMGLEAEEVWVEAADGVKVHGWYFEHPGSEQIVILSHGNAGNISGRLEIAEMFLNLGVSFLMYDYRGYGKSEGRPTEKGLYRDISAVIDFSQKEKNFKPENIILYGRSLGGAVAAYGAKTHKVGGLVLDSVFTDVPSMAKTYYPIVPEFMIRYRFSAINFLNDIEGIPVMILHSRDDEIVPYSHGENLYEAANDPKQFVELRGGHNSVFLTSYRRIKQNWNDYLNKWNK